VHIGPNGSAVGHSVREAEYAGLVGDDEIEAAVSQGAKCESDCGSGELSATPPTKSEPKHATGRLRQSLERLWHPDVLNHADRCGPKSNGRYVTVAGENSNLTQHPGIATDR